jgi:hypothetical protein
MMDEMDEMDAHGRTRTDRDGERSVRRTSAGLAGREIAGPVWAWVCIVAGLVIVLLSLAGCECRPVRVESTTARR